MADQFLILKSIQHFNLKNLIKLVFQDFFYGNCATEYFLTKMFVVRLVGKRRFRCFDGFNKMKFLSLHLNVFLWGINGKFVFLHVKTKSAFFSMGLIRHKNVSRVNLYSTR